MNGRSGGIPPAGPACGPPETGRVGEGLDRPRVGGQSIGVRVAVVAGPEGGCWLSEFAADETGSGRIVWHENLPAMVADRERAGNVRWIWAANDDLYPALLRAGVRVER